MRMAFIDAHRDRWPVVVMCRAVGLSERTYHARRHRSPSARAVRDEALKGDIRRVFEANYSCYGAGGSGSRCAGMTSRSAGAEWSG